MRQRKYTFHFIFVFIIASIQPLPAFAQATNSDVLVIEGGTLIDGNGGPPLRDAVIVIRDNRIETVSTRDQANYPANAQVLDGDGKYIVPGLMDAHVHYAGWMAELNLHFGVTSVFSIGSGGEWALAQRDAINAGKIPGPRNFVAVGSLAGARISALSARSGEAGGLSGRQVAGTAEQARAIARRLIDAGADMIKVHRGPPVEAYRAAIEEAHRAGLPVVAQPLGPTVYAREAILAGADILEHAAGVAVSVAADPSKWEGWGSIERHSLSPLPFADMDDNKAADLIELMVKEDVYLEPDFIAIGRGFQKERDKFELQDYQLLSSHDLSYIPEANRLRMLHRYHDFDDATPADWEYRNQAYQNMLRFMNDFVQAGGKVMTGTDTAGWAVPGIGIHHEMEILVDEAGLTPMQVIMAATRNIAEGFRILDDLGTIEAGKLADMMIVNEDPLREISNLQDIAWVIKDGAVIDRTFHAWFQNPLPRGAVEGSAWVRALKTQSMQGTEFGQPPPGIQSVSPTIVTEGDATLTMTILGVNFTPESLVYFGELRLPTRLVSDSEIAAVIDASLISQVGTFPVTVRNPMPLQRPEWGNGTSNKAHLLVNYRY
ncbi:MAG: amidohydrolase family protein [Gammaproteobacteria bacterium]|nr:amidohydrolase family protein [Gammaproteobacteria bacterium]